MATVASLGAFLALSLPAWACPLQLESEWEAISALPTPLESHAMVRLGDFIYVLGGWNEDRGAHSEVFVAPLRSDYSLGAWQPTTSMPLRLQHHAVFSHADSLYVVGDPFIITISGRTDFDTRQLTDQIWKIQPQSALLTEFEEIGTTLPRERHSTVLLDRTLILVAGGSAQGSLTTIEATEVSPEGTLSEWISLPPLPEARYAQAALAVDDYLYVSGGFLRFGSNETSPTVFRLQVCE